MVENGLSKASLGKPVDAEGDVRIEDFRGDSATDDIARHAVIKSIVDIEQKGEGRCASHAPMHPRCLALWMTKALPNAYGMPCTSAAAAGTCRTVSPIIRYMPCY